VLVFSVSLCMVIQSLILQILKSQIVSISSLHVWDPLTISGSPYKIALNLFSWVLLLLLLAAPSTNNPTATEGSSMH
jgi:hypothetical protein